MALRDVLVEQLAAYRFSSVELDELAISPETYQPSFEGIDLGFDVSASDWIRIIWAYLLGLLEVSRTHETNHPKILVFDEPGQQSTDPVSLDQLMNRAAESRAFGEQVIVATSEPTSSSSRCSWTWTCITSASKESCSNGSSSRGAVSQLVNKLLGWRVEKRVAVSRGPSIANADRSIAGSDSTERELRPRTAARGTLVESRRPRPALNLQCD